MITQYFVTDSGETEIPAGGRPTPDRSESGRLEVLCACDERFLPHTATMLCSLLEHNRVSRIYLFHSPGAARELPKLELFVIKYGTELVCYEMAPEGFHDLRVGKSASIANYYRLAAACILPIDINKILYLDSDIIVRRSLHELWDTDVADYALGAVIDYVWGPGKDYVELPPGTKYFNSGVMLINMDYWRRNQLYERGIAFVRNNPEKANYYDQDALNALLVDRWISLPAIWNAHDLDKGRSVPDPAIVHFIGPKPWHWSVEHAFKHEYHQYRRMTPWRRYRLEGRVGLPQRLYRSLLSFARVMLPASLRQRLRSRPATVRV